MHAVLAVSHEDAFTASVRVDVAACGVVVALVVVAGVPGELCGLAQFVGIGVDLGGGDLAGVGVVEDAVQALLVLGVQGFEVAVGL
ncbi:hypothetical protein [Streptomyces cyaneofuscatus]|uniref:hypothetical protein n=1 Tax=Streptomyces cyaneofuscatus TaxID=66883 RepID=UPI0037F3D7EA